MVQPMRLVVILCLATAVVVGGCGGPQTAAASRVREKAAASDLAPPGSMPSNEDLRRARAEVDKAAADAKAALQAAGSESEEKGAGVRLRGPVS